MSAQLIRRAGELHQRHALRLPVRGEGRSPSRQPGGGAGSTTPTTLPTAGALDSIFNRVARVLPWAESLGVSLHWIRYSTLTDTRITSGERVAAYAGQRDQAGGVTALYTRASFAELQAAHALLFD